MCNQHGGQSESGENRLGSAQCQQERGYSVPYVSEGPVSDASPTDMSSRKSIKAELHAYGLRQVSE